MQNFDINRGPFAHKNQFLGELGREKQTFSELLDSQRCAEIGALKKSCGA
jgi:hypothetical protein